MSLPLKMLHRDDTLGGMPVQLSNLGACTLSWMGKDIYSFPWIIARLRGPERGAGPLILSPDSALIYLVSPYTQRVSESTSNLSADESSPLHSGEASQTQTWSRASDSQPQQFPDASHTPQPTVMFLLLLQVSLQRTHPLICPLMPLTSSIWRRLDVFPWCSMLFRWTGLRLIHTIVFLISAIFTLSSTPLQP